MAKKEKPIPAVTDLLRLGLGLRQVCNLHAQRTLSRGETSYYVSAGKPKNEITLKLRQIKRHTYGLHLVPKP